MSHFQLEQELQSALRLDTSLNVAAGKSTRTQQPRNNSLSSTSKLLAASSSSFATAAVRSRSASRLSPSRLLMTTSQQRSSSSSRCGSPGSKSRSGNEGSRTPSLGRSFNGGGDRFIPNRSTTDMDAAHHSLVQQRENDNPAPNDEDSLADQHRRNNMSELLKGERDRILSFRKKAPAPDDAHVNSQKVLYSTGKPRAGGSAATAAAKERCIPSKPDKILDAPDLLDDFYLNLLDWSCNNHVAVALYDMLYIWNSVDGSIVELFNKGAGGGNAGGEDYVSSVSWVKEGSIIGVGDSRGAVELWDVKNSKLMRTMRGHEERVSTLDWNSHVLASGGRSGQVHLHDVRVPNHHVGTLSGHSQEICGMRWSPDQGRLLATGSNDNMVLLWDGRNTANPVHSLSAHQAAVKAVSWCPWQPRVLATGGGTNCRHVKFWNASSGNCVNSVDTGSQVSGIVWNEEYREVLTGHGFSRFQLTLWKYPAMSKVTDLKGHTARILLLIRSPDGTTVASAAADETIRFWKVWPHKDKRVDKRVAKKEPVSLFTQQSIR